jgi:hypothetical protein
MKRFDVLAAGLLTTAVVTYDVCSTVRRDDRRA